MCNKNFIVTVMRFLNDSSSPAENLRVNGNAASDAGGVLIRYRALP